MSTTQALIVELKRQLKAAGLNYAALARALGLAESSVKRMFARGEMPLSRIDAICQLLGTDFGELARTLAQARPARQQLTPEQEAALVADPKLLLTALCALSQWTLAQITASYTLGETECIACLAQLDRLGVIELRPHNRYRLRLGKTFRWRPDGPVMAFFRQRVVADYFAGGFDGDDELLMIVHGQIGAAQAPQFNERLQRLAQDFAQQHLADQRLPAADKRAFTVLIGMRAWHFSGLTHLLRHPERPPAARPA